MVYFTFTYVVYMHDMTKLTDDLLDHNFLIRLSSKQFRPIFMLDLINKIHNGMSRVHHPLWNRN